MRWRDRCYTRIDDDTWTNILISRVTFWTVLVSLKYSFHHKNGSKTNNRNKKRKQRNKIGHELNQLLTVYTKHNNSNSAGSRICHKSFIFIFVLYINKQSVAYLKSTHAYHGTAAAHKNTYGLCSVQLDLEVLEIKQVQKVLWTRKGMRATVVTVGHCTHALS